MFEVERFIAECQRASAAAGSASGELGEPRRANLHVLFRSAEFTSLNVVWGPRMSQLPHNHRMWAVIGIYTGREDNIFWRRVTGNADGRIEAAGAIPLGHDVIHSVLNPIKRLTGAIHVYGGDFFALPRSEWDPERLIEQPFDVEKALALFEESNRLHPLP